MGIGRIVVGCLTTRHRINNRVIEASEEKHDDRYVVNNKTTKQLEVETNEE